MSKFITCPFCNKQINTKNISKFRNDYVDPEFFNIDTDAEAEVEKIRKHKNIEFGTAERRKSKFDRKYN